MFLNALFTKKYDTRSFQNWVKKTDHLEGPVILFLEILKYFKV